MGPLSFSQKYWSSAPEISDLQALFSLLLEERELHNDAEKTQKFLNPTLTDLHIPWNISGMKKAVDRILQALENEERIVIFGDFDADGITATVILVQGLRELGGSVSYRIPERKTDSHGLKNHLLEEIADQNVSLVITCDCGINDQKEVHFAKTLGMDVIITDHHEPLPNQTPHDAIAILNPRQSHCTYPEKNLSGAGIAFKLISALAEKVFNDSESITDFLPKFFEICAIGLIADCVELTGENRILTKFGLQKLHNTSWDGLEKMIERCNIDPRSIDEETIGFTIAPRLNASSRIGDVLTATQLFLGDTDKNYDRLTQLHTLNEQRKELTQKGIEACTDQIQKDASCQVFFHETWDPGILGLIAGRYTESLGVPIIATCLREDGKLTASCRAPEGYCMVSGLDAISDLLLQFGGHRGAGGFTALPENIDAIKENLLAHYAQYSGEASPIPITAWINPSIAQEDLYEFLSLLAPFGPGNPQPIFGLKNIEVIDYSAIGNGNNHLRFQGKYDTESINFISFFAENFLKKIKIGQHLDVLFTLSQNYWNGEAHLQMRVKDLREST